MTMNEFIKAKNHINDLINSELETQSAWAECRRVSIHNEWERVHNELKSECGSDYNMINSLAEGIIDGNDDPNLSIPIFDENGARKIDRILRDLGVMKFTATKIDAKTINILNECGWGWKGMTEIIGDPLGTKTPALVIERQN